VSRFTKVPVLFRTTDLRIEARSKPVRRSRAEGYDHFETAVTEANPYGVLSRAMLEILGPLDAMVQT
jgi:hypothetical protein